MLVGVERLLLKLRQPRSRADEVSAVRARARVEAGKPIAADEQALAHEIRAKKLAVVALLDGVRSCATCARGLDHPVGTYAGGACCAGTTSELFDERELAALVHAGTRARDLVPPSGRDAHGGCAFRGATGCSLAVLDRPARCVHYVCTDLRHELFDRAQLDAVEAALAALAEAVARYNVVQAARADREVLAPLVDALVAATRR